jgi:hypothetical protein
MSDYFQGRIGVRRRSKKVARAFQDIGSQLEVYGVIIDNQNANGFHNAASKAVPI